METILRKINLAAELLFFVIASMKLSIANMGNIITTLNKIADTIQKLGSRASESAAAF